MSMYGCSETTQFFAIVGMIVVAVGIYVGVFAIVREILLAIKGKRLSELSMSGKEAVNLGAAFWPITIVGGIIYLVGKWIILPFIAATKKDLRETEQRFNKKIILNCVTPTNSKTSKGLKVGDLIKGVKGNPDNYNHLNEGCLCKILSIDDKGSMKVVLVDHKKFNEHKDVIGNTFKAPARNFVKARR